MMTITTATRIIKKWSDIFDEKYIMDYMETLREEAAEKCIHFDYNTDRMIQALLTEYFASVKLLTEVREELERREKEDADI